MSAPEQQLPTQGRIFNVLERLYRTRVYRPARYYLTWYFLASVWVTLGFMLAGFYSYRAGGIDLLESNLWWVMSGFLAGLFLSILSTYNGMIASSLHLCLGDRGIYSLGSTPATAPIITSSTFLCNTPQQKALYDSKYHGARVTRFYLWRWGRKGGCMNWPGKAGGKSEGFWAGRFYAWDEAEIAQPDGSVKKEVIEKQPCPTCNRDRTTADDWRGFVRVPALTMQELQRMAQDTPGFKRGGVIDVRLQIMADRYLEELPYPIADAIQHDEEFRASSRVDVGWDPLPESGSLGMVMSHNAEVELFGLQFTSKLMRAQSVSLHQTLAVLGQLRGPLGGTGQQ